MIRSMGQPQTGIFALGTASHAYLEFDAEGDAGEALVRAVASLREPRTTMGGVNLVAGFRPELWRRSAPDDAPQAVGFDEEIVGVDAYMMPATQHDAMLWLSGSAYDVVFDTARAAIAELEPLAAMRRKPPAGRTTTTWTSPASSTAPRTRRCSTRPMSC
jgi:porphyrinogen peroxidase